MAEIADYDRKQILKRLSDGKAQRKRQGQHAHGGIPYGYRSAGKGRLEPIRHERKPGDSGTEDVTEDGEEVKMVRRIFELAARKGYSASRIARELNDERRPSPQGKKWLPAVVVRILRNPIYAGERYGRKGAQPAIVSRRTWNAAQATLDRHRKRRT